MKNERVTGSAEPAPLTSGDIRILETIRDGHTKHREIAVDLEISVRTVSRHLRGIYNALGARNKTHAVVEAYKQGFIQIPQRPL